MSGIKCDVATLNNTLRFTCNMLHTDMPDTHWFVTYGTLLGVVRDKSCISGDDDIDIMICCSHEKLSEIVCSYGLESDVRTLSQWGVSKRKHIVKTLPVQELKLASIDFYICESIEPGTFYNPWEKDTWFECFIPGTEKLVETVCCDALMYIPHNVESKLTCVYGDWKRPSKDKYGGGDNRFTVI